MKQQPHGIDPDFVHALSKYERESKCLAYDELPPGIDLGGDPQNKWDLSQWTVVTTDACLHRLVQERKGKNGIEDGKMGLYEGILISELNLPNGNKITNKGLRVLVEHMPNLTSINLENVFQIDEKALAHLVKSPCGGKLKNLNLSGCLGISGTGFAILGQHASRLKNLKLSGCRQVTPWALMKIFQGCQDLEHLDISYCSQLTDQEVKVMADCCRELKEINMKECRQVSDVGLLSVKACTKLLVLVLARSDLVLRITDISLLAISEGCHDLESLDIAGCNMISDVGISWLAKGCKSLRRLNFSNCPKITNGGMRYLGEECKELQGVLLINLKKVSDVGIRYLASGCQDLRYLNVSGVHLLTDGVKRDFGHEGLQSLGDAECIGNMRKLNLNGCFHVKRVALQAVSKMKFLDSLILSNCPSLTIEGMVAVSKSCTRLSHLSFASCGECVTNAMLKSVFSRLQELRIIDLTDCIEVGRKGMESLSQCSKLQSVNLSGCKKISNDAILALSEGNYYPGLKELYLNRCNKLNDTSLSWIAGSFSDRLSKVGAVTLVTLALKGTKISARAVKAVKDKFPYSSLKRNDYFFGFLAQHRFNDRRLINQHYKRSEAASVIQATMRGFLFRGIVLKAKDQFIMRRMATRIATIWRGYLARALARKIRFDKWQRRVMAVRIQCMARVASAKSHLNHLRHRQWKKIAPLMTTIIQKVYRGHRGRIIAKETKRNFVALEAHRYISSIKIQRAIRMANARRKMGDLKAVMDALHIQRIKLCTKIQTQWRMQIARTVLQDKRVEQARICLKEQKSKRIIIRSIRRFRFRKSVEKLVNQTQFKSAVAKRIQQWYFATVEQIEVKRKERLRLEKLRNLAAIVIQKLLRRKMAYRTFKKLLSEREALLSLQLIKSFLLTRWWRGCIARSRLNSLRQAYRERLERKFAVQTASATGIASGWRGYLGRKKTRAKREKKKSRWKQMWSDDDHCHYYYNQVTGESRWRKPQDLLDLEPRPVCNNCDYYEAQVECSNCAEWFCNGCWDAVHFGGNRKKHIFRSLYDYYGKRVDYGDGQFPSKWPSEIIQDDINGWKQR